MAHDDQSRENASRFKVGFRIQMTSGGQIRLKGFDISLAKDLKTRFCIHHDHTTFLMSFYS